MAPARTLPDTLKAPGAADEGAAAGPVVNSVVHALAVLRLLARSDDAIGVTVIAKSLNIKRSSAFNILKTLSSENFLSFNELTKRYSLGPGALDLARLALDGNRTFNRIRSLIADVSDEFGGTTQLWKLKSDEERLILVGLVESRAIMRIQVSVGQRIPALSGAAGRYYAGHLLQSNREKDRDRVRQRFERVRWEDGMDFEKFSKEAKASVKRGWAVDDGQFIKGVVTVAAAICDTNGSPEFYLTNTTFAGQRTSEGIAQLGAALSNHARQAEVAIFGSATD